MSKFGTRVAVVVAFVGLVSVKAPADITLDVVPSSAPNFFGSPSWGGYLTNALTSLEGGLGSTGDRSTDPTAYEVAGPIVQPGDAIVTSFNSWRGVASPGAPFGSELGNRMHFGLHVFGDGVMQFRLEDLTFDMVSSDGVLNFSGDFVGFSYSSARFGVDWGPDRAKGGGDDIFYTTDNGTTPVDEIVYVGVGNAYWPTAPDFPQNQEGIDDVIEYINSVEPISFSTTYSIPSLGGGPTFDGTGEVTIIPAPGAALLAAVGFGLFGWVKRRM